MSKIGFGLIGLGGIQYAHGIAFSESADVEVVAVCDIVEERARERGTALDATPYTDYRALLADPRVQAVDVTLPHSAHYAVCKAALQAGKHVLVEKPMVPTYAEARELVDLARHAGVKFTVAENTRFVKAYQEAARMLGSGELGEPRLVRTLIYGSEVRRLSDPTLWKGRKDGTVGGAILDAGPHSFYLLKWLFGEITEVQAVTGKLVPQSEVEDNAFVFGKLAGGAIFSTDYTFTAEIPWGERLEIYGSKGSLIVDQISNPPAIHYKGGQDYDGSPVTAIEYEPMRWKFTSIMAGVTDFIEAVRDNRPTLVDPDDGAYVIKVCERAYASVGAQGHPMTMQD